MLLWRKKENPERPKRGTSQRYVWQIRVGRVYFPFSGFKSSLFHITIFCPFSIFSQDIFFSTLLFSLVAQTYIYYTRREYKRKISWPVFLLEPSPPSICLSTGRHLFRIYTYIHSFQHTVPLCCNRIEQMS